MAEQSARTLDSVQTTRLRDSSYRQRWSEDFMPAMILAALLSAGCQGEKSAEHALEKPADSIVDSDAADQRSAMSGHDQMVATMQELAEWSRTNHPILGDRGARILLAQLQQLVASRRHDPDGLNAFLDLHMQLGQAESQLGKLKRGIRHYETVLNTFKQQPATAAVKQDTLLEVQYRLAVCWMRMGETQNCCLRNSPDSCLLPIRGTGIHAHQENSKKAIEYFTAVLNQASASSPLSIKAKWLLNIMYMTIDGYPDQVPPKFQIDPRVFESEEPFRKFNNVAGQLGIDTFSLLGGAIVDDFTGDRYLDIVVSDFDLQEQTRFFRNNRDGSFTDITGDSNLEGLVGGCNLVHADYDNDGDNDILMLRGAWMAEAGCIPNSLLRNDGKGRFTDVTVEAGMGQSHYPTQTAAWADFDNDGDLDAFIGNEHLGGSDFAPCQLFRNNGNGTFTDIADAAGVTNGRYAKGVAWGDYDGDDDPDLYVSNYGTDNRLFRNQGDGTFIDVANKLGVTGPQKSFPIWFWDFNNDGNLDLFVSSYEWDLGNLAAVVSSRQGLRVDFEPLHLYRGDGDGGFEDVAVSQNLARISLPMGANFGDLDNDGFLDFYLGTGYPDYEALMPNVMYRNRGGSGFSDVTTAGGFGHLQKGHGVAFADLDNDGDQDVFQQLGGFLPGDKFYDALFENPGFGNHWITVRLVGVQTNRSAIGAQIRIVFSEAGETRSVYKHVNSGGSFGANPFQQSIGLGSATRIEKLEVYWPTSKTRQVFRDVAVDQMIEITEGVDQIRRLDLGVTRFTVAPDDSEQSN